MRIKKITLADARPSYNECGETTTSILKNFVPDDEDNSGIGDTLYEDQRRVQIKDVCDDSSFIRADHPEEPKVPAKRSDSHPYFEKYKGSKSKVSNMVYTTYDIAIKPKVTCP